MIYLSSRVAENLPKIFVRIIIFVALFFIIFNADVTAKDLNDACCIWDALIYYFFAVITPTIGRLDVIQASSLSLLIYSPFLVYSRHLKRQATEYRTIYHSQIKERNRILFWQAQRNDLEQTQKTLLAPDVLEQMNTNSTADVSLRMIEKPLFGQKSKKAEDNDIKNISAQLNELTTAIKNLTPPKAE